LVHNDDDKVYVSEDDGKTKFSEKLVIHENSLTTYITKDAFMFSVNHLQKTTMS